MRAPGAFPAARVPRRTPRVPTERCQRGRQSVDRRSGGDPPARHVGSLGQPVGQRVRRGLAERAALLLQPRRERGRRRLRGAYLALQGFPQLRIGSEAVQQCQRQMGRRGVVTASFDTQKRAVSAVGLLENTS